MSGYTETFKCVDCGVEQAVTVMCGSPPPTRCTECDEKRCREMYGLPKDKASERTP